MGFSENQPLIAATFSVKNEAKLSAVRLAAEVGGEGGGVSSVLKVEKSLCKSVALLILFL